MKKGCLVALVMALLPGCGVPDYVKQSNAPVILRIVGFAPEIVTSDVVTTRGVFANNVTVALAVRSTNPAVTVPQVPMAVFMERYEIRYFRSDGRNTEGVDVPHRISGPMAGVIDALASGSTPFTIEVVRLQAKLEPPLRNLISGGAIVLTTFAEITVYGRTTAGQLVTTSARLQIDFADFGE